MAFVALTTLEPWVLKIFVLAIFVVVVAKLIVSFHFSHGGSGTLAPLPIWPIIYHSGLKVKSAVLRRESNPRPTECSAVQVTKIKHQAEWYPLAVRAALRYMNTCLHLTLNNKKSWPENHVHHQGFQREASFVRPPEAIERTIERPSKGYPIAIQSPSNRHLMPSEKPS